MSWIETPEVSHFGQFNLTDLNVDEAWLNVTTTTRESLWLYELSSNCHQCPFQLSSTDAITVQKSLIKKINTAYEYTYRLRTSGKDTIIGVGNDSGLFCELTHNFGEFGVYELLINGSRGKTEMPSCEITTRLNPVNIYIPILLCALFYFALAIIWCIIAKYKDKLNTWSSAFLSRFTRSQEAISNSEPISSSSITPLVAEDNVSSSTSGSSATNSKGISVKPTSKNKKKKSPKNKENLSTNKHPPHESRLSGPSSLSEEVLDHKDQDVGDPVSDSAQFLEKDRDGQELDARMTSNSKRFRFLDTFRGICIVLMIFVNDGGAEYFFFDHASWDGLNVADLVFPWFLMGMGISIPISITGQLRKGVLTCKIFKTISIRSFKLILIGLALNTTKGSKPVNFGLLRLPGVLQRFGICYFVVASLFLFFSAKKVVSKMEQNRETRHNVSVFEDLKTTWIPWLIVILILGAHYFLSFFLHVPGCPTGYLGPGGLHNGNAYPGYCVGGATGYIDRMLFSVNHIYKWPTPRSVYKCDAYDPEGFLGILNSIGQVWFGLQAGIILLMFPKPTSRMIRWLIIAVLTGLAGLLLCEGKQTGGWIPINKNLWSLSFTLVTTSLALVLFTVLYIIVDVKQWWTGSPFFECGMNSIALYVGHTIAYAMLPWHYAYENMRTHFSHLVESLWGTSLWVLIALYLYNKRLFYSV